MSVGHSFGVDGCDATVMAMSTTMMLIEIDGHGGGDDDDEGDCDDVDYNEQDVDDGVQLR